MIGSLIVKTKEDRPMNGSTRLKEYNSIFNTRRYILGVSFIIVLTTTNNISRFKP